MNVRNDIKIKTFATALMAAALIFPLQAKDTYWNVADGYWNVASNWDNGLPGRPDSAYINNGGTLRINNDFYLASNVSWVYIGSTADGSGRVIVENGGTLNIGIATFRVGNFGYGEVMVETGGKVTSANTLYFGREVGSEGKVTVNGLGDKGNFEWLMTGGTLHVGNFGKAEFTLNDASAQLPGYLYLGTEATGNGTMTMNGDSYATISTLVVGDKGVGTFNLNGNSEVKVSSVAYLGRGIGGEGTLILSDNATLTNAGSFHIGQSGKANLTIQDNASLSTTYAFVGSGSVITVSGNGTLNSGRISVEGTGSGLTISGNGKIIATDAFSLSSSSTMDILDKGSVYNTNATIGLGATVKVSGSEAKWESSGYLYAGSTGAGNSLLIENGGRVKNAAGYMGVYAGSDATVTVRGASSRWDNTSSLVVAYYGNASLAIEDGTVTNTVGAVAYVAGSAGNVSISGNGTWNNSSELSVGEAGRGTLTLSDNASVSATVFALGNQAGSIGTLNIMSDGVKITGTDGVSLLDIQGGDGTGRVVFGHSGNLQFSNIMSGANLSVEHSGSGTTILDVANTYIGGTTISKGVVIAGNSSALGSGDLRINGGTLRSIVANLGVANLSMESGAISLADGLAQTLSVIDFEMSGGILGIDILDLDSFDLIISGGGLLTLSNGTLVLNGYEGFEGVLGVSGNRYRIFDGFDPISGNGLSITNYDTANWIANIDENGYLYFTEVPEPATIAAIFGALALALAVYRRKK